MTEEERLSDLWFYLLLSSAGPRDRETIRRTYRREHRHSDHDTAMAIALEEWRGKMGKMNRKREQVFHDCMRVSRLFRRMYRKHPEVQDVLRCLGLPQLAAKLRRWAVKAELIQQIVDAGWTSVISLFKEPPIVTGNTSSQLE